MSKSLFFLFTLVVSLNAPAKIFRNAYVAFELPDTWNCTLEQTEWVCRSSNDKEAKEAIIILTAKEVGPMDSFTNYKNHLATAQPVAYKTSSGGGVSRIIYPPKETQINDQQWIDGLHLASEVPNYYTRYLATIKDRIAILVTFSAHKDFYQKYSYDFFRSVMSLRVIATKNLLAKPEMGPIRGSGETLGAPVSAAMPTDLLAGAAGVANDLSGGGGKTKQLLIGLAVLLAAVGAYIFIRSRK